MDLITSPHPGAPAGIEINILSEFVMGLSCLVGT